jgi:hypothetical protein
MSDADPQGLAACSSADSLTTLVHAQMGRSQTLPDHALAPLLRALACIPRTADARLLLRKVQEGRRPGMDSESDFDVVFRGRKVGRIWRYDYAGARSDEGARYLWHWYIRGVEGRADIDGHAATFDAAMADFRRAWDAPAANVIGIPPAS